MCEKMFSATRPLCVATLLFVFVPSSAAATLDRAVTLKAMPTCELLVTSPLASVTSFAVTDPAVVVAFSISNAKAGDIAALTYLTPGGQVYGPASGPWEPLTAADAAYSHNCFFDASLRIAGTAVAGMQGTWSVRVIVNNVVLTTLSFTIGSATPTCTYSLSATSASVSNGSTTGSFNVTAPSGCNWTASSNATGWLTVIGGASGSGNGIVAWSATANTSTSSRSGVITVMGQTYTVTQAGASGGDSTLTGNLIQNGDAEAGPASPSYSGLASIPGWQTDGNMTVYRYDAGDYLSPTTPGPSNRGNNFFGGGFSGAAKITQSINLSSASAAIDAGNQAFTLDAWLGGWDGQDDSAVLRVTFQSATGATLGTESVGPVLSADRNGITGLLDRSTTGRIPAATRTALVSLEINRSSGSANDGYADNLFFGLGGIIPAPTTGAPAVTFKSTALPFNDDSIGRVLGWDFTPTTAIAVSALGFWASSGSSLAAGHDVIVYRDSDQSVVVPKTTIPAGCAAESSFCYVAVTPVSLSAGTKYVIVGSWPPNTNDGFTGSPQWSSGKTYGVASIATDSRITLGLGRFTAGASAIAFPGQTDTRVFFGPNFKLSGAAPPVCTYTLDATTKSVGAAATSGTVNVTAGSGCTWTAISNATGWLNVTAGASGSGNGAVTYSVSANTATASRTGTLTIAGQTVTLTQAGATPPPVGDGTVTEYPTPTRDNSPWGITRGPDGALWFTETQNAKIGRITTGGSFTEYNITDHSSGPTGIVAGPDGALWFGEGFGNKIGRITTAGAITEYPVPTPDSEPVGITVGPDGALWFTEAKANKIGRITTAGAITEFAAPGKWPWSIVTGPDGALWFTENSSGDIGRITTSGATTSYPIPTANSTPRGITLGPDGALWFAEFAGKIGRITTTGAITEFPLTKASFFGITVGSDGNLWATDSGNNQIVRITTSGVMTGYPVPTSLSIPWEIAGGSDGALWFTENSLSSIGRILPPAPGPACAYSLSPTSASPSSAAGTGSFNVSAGSGCAWTATSNAAGWLTISGSASGSGDGTVNYAVTANTGAQRTGTITVQGQTFTVTQAAGTAPPANCDYSLSVTGSISLPGDGFSTSIGVTTQSGCSWTAVSNNPDWIKITSGASGTGSGYTSITGTPNPFAGIRRGSVTIAGQTVTINQRAGTAPANAPTITGVGNAASMIPTSLPSGGIAQGAIFSLVGSNLGPGAASDPTSGATGSVPLSASLAGVSVQVTQGSTTLTAYPVFAWTGRVDAIMPSNMPLGAVTITLTYNGASSLMISATVVASNFAAYTTAGKAGGHGLIMCHASPDDAGTQNSNTVTARPGQTVTLIGTGLGAISGPDNAAPPTDDLSAPVQVMVADKPATVLHRSRVSGQPGKDRIQFQVPGDAPPGCTVPVQVITSGTIYSSIVTMAIDAGGQACTSLNPWIDMSDKGGKVANILLVRVQAASTKPGTPDVVIDEGLANFINSPPGGTSVFSLLSSIPALGTCATLGGTLRVTASASGLPTGLGALDAGKSLTLSGPAGSADLILGENDDGTPTVGTYSAPLGGGFPGSSDVKPPFLNPGSYTISGPGGKDVGPFSANFTIPPPPVWTNKDALMSIDRSAGFTFTWSGGTDAQFLMLAGGGQDSNSQASIGFICFAPSAPGSFTVPPSVLANLPPSSGDDKLGLLFGVVPAGGQMQFTASGLDTGLIFYGLYQATYVTVK